MIPDFKTYIRESVWSDIHSRSVGDEVRKEDEINDLDFADFFVYLKNRYEVCIPDPQHFFGIGQWLDPTTMIGNISIPIEKKSPSNIMFRIQANVETNEFVALIPNKNCFRSYPREMENTFGDKYDLNISPELTDYTITPKSGKITNRVCVDVLDKLLGMVENPILKIKE